MTSLLLPPPQNIIHQLAGLNKLLVTPSPLRLGDRKAMIAPKRNGVVQIDLVEMLVNDTPVLRRMVDYVYLFGVEFQISRRRHSVMCAPDTHIGYVTGTELLNPQPSPNMAQFDQVRYAQDYRRFINCRTGDTVIRADVLFLQTLRDDDNNITGVDTRVIEVWNP